MNFYILTSDKVHPIENIENLNSGHVISNDTLEMLVKSKDNRDNFIFISNDPVPNGFTIGESVDSSISLVTDDNIQDFVGKPISHVSLFVDNLDNFYRNYSLLAPNVYGALDFKFKSIEEYDYDKLDEALGRIVDDLYMAEKIDDAQLIPCLNSFRTRNKFSFWGVSDFFVDTEGYVYYHPSFYYQQSNIGKIGRFDEVKIDEHVLHFSKPHLICINCETFYCDRDIYRNKLRTSEYMVPCSSSCKLTTLLAKHSKKLLNRLVDKELFEITDLDRVSDFNDEADYNKFLRKECLCNKIKQIDFYDRKLYSEGDK